MLKFSLNNTKVELWMLEQDKGARVKTDRIRPATKRQRERLIAQGIDPTGFTIKQAGQALNPQHNKRKEKSNETNQNHPRIHP